MMNNSQAETAIFTKLKAFTGVSNANLRYENQPLRNGKAHTPPINESWCKVSIQYADSQMVGMAETPCIRDNGIINIQCFTPKNKGTQSMTALCDAWRAFLQNYSFEHLEIYLVHAPASIDDDDFLAKIIRAEFRVN